MALLTSNNNPTMQDNNEFLDEVKLDQRLNDEPIKEISIL